MAAELHANHLSASNRPQKYQILISAGMGPSAVDFRTFYPYTPKRRKRTTHDQLKILEDTFKRDTKPDGVLRKRLAVELGMAPRGVQVWFQNRRAKEKTKARKANAKATSTLELRNNDASARDASPSLRSSTTDFVPDMLSEPHHSPVPQELELGETSSQDTVLSKFPHLHFTPSPHDSSQPG